MSMIFSDFYNLFPHYFASHRSTVCPIRRTFYIITLLLSLSNSFDLQVRGFVPEAGRTRIRMPIQRRTLKSHRPRHPDCSLLSGTGCQFEEERWNSHLSSIRDFGISPFWMPEGFTFQRLTLIWHPDPFLTISRQDRSPPQ